MGYSNKEFKGLPMQASITVIFFISIAIVSQ